MLSTRQQPLFEQPATLVHAPCRAASTCSSSRLTPNHLLSASCTVIQPPSLPCSAQHKPAAYRTLRPWHGPYHGERVGLFCFACLCLFLLTYFLWLHSCHPAYFACLPAILVHVASCISLFALEVRREAQPHPHWASGLPQSTVLNAQHPDNMRNTCRTALSCRDANPMPFRDIQTVHRRGFEAVSPTVHVHHT